MAKKKPLKQYSWKVGFRCSANAEAVGKELETLGKNVNIDTVLELAKKKTSAMHDYFEWDDKKAAAKYRRKQATDLISALEVTFIKDEEETKSVQAFVSLKYDTDRVPIENVIEDVDMYSILKERAFRELQAIKLKYANIQEVQDILKDI